MTDTYIYLIREGDWDSDSLLPGADHAPSAEMQEVLAQHGAFAEAVKALGARITAGQALANASHGGVVRPGAGDRKVEDAVWTDSPYADSKELVTGFYAVEVDDEDTARQVAAMVPTGNLVEWRKVVPTM